MNLSFRSAIPVAACLVAAGIGAFLLFPFAPLGDPTLAPFVRGKPPFPVIFTSRTSAASLRAAAEPGEGITFPGRPQWQASEGRLRLLTTGGEVHELTWQKPLPDGGFLVDVMSPTLSPDGRTVVFAARRTDADAGRFRIYSVGINGKGLHRLTGGTDDLGCVSLPPMRFDREGKLLPDDERRRLDYDDVDPVLLADGTLVFASSRLPDLGSNFRRRATQIWLQPPGKPPHPLSANRANDRWPFQLNTQHLCFSLWSHQDEVINDEGTDLVRYDPPRDGLTARVDRWMGVSIFPTGERFGLQVKVPQPVWRLRPLGNNHFVFMTRPDWLSPETHADDPENGPLAIAQSHPGRIASAPSALAKGSALPHADSPALEWAPSRDETGRRWSLATPGPCPPDRLLLSAAALRDGTVTPAEYGVCMMTQDGWSAEGSGVLALQPLFDDPSFVDAEPVAVYARPIDPISPQSPSAGSPTRQHTIPLADGRTFVGTAGQVHGQGLTVAFPELTGLPGQRTDTGQEPIFSPFPEASIHQIAFYSSHRDRFDDPEQPVVSGKLEKLLTTTVDTAGGGSFKTWIPTGSPTMLVGLDAGGKVVEHLSPATDREGRQARFYALAGDHVSGVRPGGYHFCTGCHVGHSNPGDHQIAERARQ